MESNENEGSFLDFGLRVDGKRRPANTNNNVMVRVVFGDFWIEIPVPKSMVFAEFPKYLINTLKVTSFAK